jgi:hypothetical protein
MPSAVSVPKKTVQQEPFESELATFVASLAERNQAIARAHAELAERMERLLGKEQLIAPGARLLRFALRSIARRNRRAAWQHLKIAIKARRLVEQMAGGYDLADVADCFEDSQ